MKGYKFLRLSSTKVRILYWLIVILLMVFVVSPMFFFFYSFNEDQVKQMLFDQFDSNNYHIEVGGKITPKFWHGLSFEANGLEVSTKNDIPLFEVKTVSCQLSWFDLALGHYKIKRVALNDVTIDEKNVMEYGLDNLLNWSQIDKSSFSRMNILTVFGINSVNDKDLYPIHDGVLQIDKNGSFTNFNLGFKLVDRNAFVSSSGKILAISNDVLQLSDFATSIYNNDMRINLSADTNYTISDRKLVMKGINGKLIFKNYSGTVTAEILNLSKLGTNVSNVNMHLNFNNDFANQSFDIAIDNVNNPRFKQFLADNLQLKYSLGIQQSKLNFNANLNQVQLNNESITSNTCTNEISFSTANFKNNKIKANLAGICKYDLVQNILDYNMKGTLNQEPLLLALKVYNTADKPKIIVSGAIDDLDLSRFEVDADKFMPFYDDSSPLPFSWLSLFDMQGDLSIKHFTLDRINLKDVTTKFELQDQTLNISKLRASVYNGTLIGSGKIAKLDNGYSIQAVDKVNNLDLERMFEDLFDVKAITGVANLSIDVVVNNANSYNDLHKHLNGKINVDASHGAFQGVDFNLFATPKIGFPNTASTIFKQLKAHFNFVDGISKNGKVVFNSPYVIAKGNGEVDFVNTTLDYKLTIKSALPQNDQQISSVLIPVIASGDLFNPKITIQNIHLYTGQTQILRAGTSVYRNKPNHDDKTEIKTNKKIVSNRAKHLLNKKHHSKVNIKNVK